MGRRTMRSCTSTFAHARAAASSRRSMRCRRSTIRPTRRSSRCSRRARSHSPSRSTKSIRRRGCCATACASGRPAPHKYGRLIKMPLRDPVFNPPFNIVRASHLELGVADVARSRAFYVDCLGYIVSDEDNEALYLRAVEERNHHSLVIRKSRDIVALALGFKVASEEDLDKAATWLKARNMPVEWPEHPHQGRTLRTHDPVGMPVDFYFKMDRVK